MKYVNVYVSNICKIVKSTKAGQGDIKIVVVKLMVFPDLGRRHHVISSPASVDLQNNQDFAPGV